MCVVLLGSFQNSSRPLHMVTSLGIDWSLQPNWKAAPAVFVDASLLAVGTRAGIVTFLRCVLCFLMFNSMALFGITIPCALSQVQQNG